MKIIKLYEEYERTNVGINSIRVGTWLRTRQEEFEVIKKDGGKIIGQSFCNPDRVMEININDILEVINGNKEKRLSIKDKSKLNYDDYYRSANLIENNDLYDRTLPKKILPGREKYLQGNRVVLFVDDNRNPFTSDTDWITDFSGIGTEDIYVKVVKNIQSFIEHITKYGLPEAVLFDNDLGHKKGNGSGAECAVWLVNYCLDNSLKLPEWSIISANPYGKCRIGSVLRKYESLVDEERENLRLNKIMKNKNKDNDN